MLMIIANAKTRDLDKYDQRGENTSMLHVVVVADVKEMWLIDISIYKS